MTCSFFARRRVWAGVSALPKGAAVALATLCKKSYTLFSIEDLFIANGCEPSWRIPPFKPHDSERMNEAQGWLDGILVYAPDQERAIVQTVCEAMLANPRLPEQSRRTLHEIIAQLALPAPANPLDVYNLHPTVRRLAGPLLARQHWDEAVLGSL